MKAKQVYKRLVKDAKAVSPIIATLMLVLVAVGSASAFYVFFSGWQSGVEENIGQDNNIKASIQVAGLVDDGEFGDIARQYFEAANPTYKIGLEPADNDATVRAVGLGNTKIGIITRDLTDAETNDKYPDLDQDGKQDLTGELKQITIGYVDDVTPINVILVNDPIGASFEFVKFCQQPENNQRISEDGNYHSIYQTDLTALFIWSQELSVHQNEYPVTFDASESFDLDGVIEKYEWKWRIGDLYVKEDKIVTNPYRQTGVFDVSLKVTDNDGNTNEITVEIEIS